MESFCFQNPTQILFGQKQIEKLGAKMKKDGISRCLMVAGGGSIRKNDAYRQVQQSLMKAGIHCTENWGVRSNPRLDKVREIIAQAKEEKVEAILAVGGGSVLDTAKAVAAGVYLNDIWNAFSMREKVQKALPLYTVLTLSATGSEMNGNAVITNSDTLHKWGLYSPHIYPRLSIIDPSLQMSLPFRLTAAGAMDAIAHILEYYFVNDTANSTLDINDALLKNIVYNTDILKKDGKNYEARANLAWSATMAFNGISGVGLKDGDWGCHNIEHALSALNPDISHGEGLAVVFPAWIDYVSDKQPSRFYRWAKNVWNHDSSIHAVKSFRQKLKDWELATSLRDLGIKERDLPKLLDIIICGGSVGNEFKLSREDVQAILMLAF